MQGKLQLQLHNAEATEQLLKADVSAERQQLMQAQKEVQQVTADARAAADAANARHQAELQRLQLQLGSEGASQVRAAFVKTCSHEVLNETQCLLCTALFCLICLGLLMLQA